ncbi:TPA: ABC transporter substrate-binding protein [Stenotrophomonas maltophilia]|uniref:ABC transporter substrate-binding protein n=1 Tax=Stenotrophomonas maltophilia group TaxID=995085 RepID=UPI0013127528|nr:ABC transporter substrate-binding protein [Stenotrophomonas maltophilia]HEL3817020.1 ABC transporter substrate-binding protein [Stenotrophomonas maltophilia]
MRRRALLQAFALAPLLAAGAELLAMPAQRVLRLGAPKATPRRVFAAGPPAAVLLAAMAPERLLGWPMKVSPDALAQLPAVVRTLPVVGRLAGRGSTVSLERLLAMQPDLVLDAGDFDASYRDSAERVWKQTAIPFELIAGRLPDHPAQLRHVGRLLGVAARGEALAQAAEAQLALVREVLAARPEAARPSVYYGRGSDGLESGLSGSINTEVIEFCGGRNVAAGAGAGGLARVSFEQLLAWDPDVILTQDAGFAAHAAQDPRWRALRAVREARLYCAPVLPFGWLDGPPGINRLPGLPWLLSRLHPGATPALAPAALRGRISALHQLLWGQPLPTALARSLQANA